MRGAVLGGVFVSALCRQTVRGACLASRNTIAAPLARKQTSDPNIVMPLDH